MARPLSMDLRMRIAADCDAGMRVVDVAHKYHVSRRVVHQLLKLRRESGSLAPRQGKPGRKRKLESYRQEIEVAIDENADLTLQDLIDRFALSVSRSTLWESLKRWGLSLKKSHSRGRTVTA